MPLSFETTGLGWLALPFRGPPCCSRKKQGQGRGPAAPTIRQDLHCDAEVSVVSLFSEMAEKILEPSNSLALK